MAETDSTDILQLLKEVSEELKLEEMIVFDGGVKIPPNQQNNIENYQNIRQTFGFKITNAKHIGQFVSNLKPIYIESNLTSILKNKTFFQAENGKIHFHKVPNPTSLTLKQIRNIMVKLLFYQYDVFNGFSPYQSFLTCLYLFEDLYPQESQEINTNNPKYLKVKLLNLGLKLFLLTFFKTQCIANEIYAPNSIFSNEWSSFDFIKEESNFCGHNFLISNDLIKEIIEKEQSSTESAPKSTIEQTLYFNDLLDQVNHDIDKLITLSKTDNLTKEVKNLFNNEYTKQILNLISFEQQICKVFLQDTDDNVFIDESLLKDIEDKQADEETTTFDPDIKLSHKLLPETVDDLEENTPGFCKVINYPETGIKLNSDIKTYSDLKIKYVRMMYDVKYIDKFVSNLPKQSKIEDLTNIFIDWNSTHCESITMIRFYFFRKFIPYYSNDKWEYNLFRSSGSKSTTTTFKNFVIDTFNKVKKIPPVHRTKMELLFGKFFSYCLRLLIFKPYKLQKSLLKTVIIQWVRNISQIYKFDETQKEQTKVFSKEMKSIFFNILHADFKYYISYCFLTEILEMNNIKDKIFMYGFLFINIVLSPIFSDNKKAKEAFIEKDDIKQQKSYNTERMKELRIYKICFELLLYQYLNTVNHSKKELLMSFRQNFYNIQKNVKKEYKISDEISKNTKEFNIDEIFTCYNDYLNAFYDVRARDFGDFTKRITEELDIIVSEKENITSNRRLEYYKKFIKIAEKSTLEKFFKKPLSFKFVFENAAYPYLIIKEQP